MPSSAAIATDAPNAPTPSLGRDLIGGVVVFLVAIPLCLGIALASGAPLMSGLIAGIIGGIVVGAISGSHVSVSGPAAGLAAIVLSQIDSLGGFQPFLLAVAIAGLMQIAFGLLKGGALASFFPNSVIRGLLAAIGVLLILKQIPHLVGHDTDFDGEMAFTQPDGDNTFTALMTAMKAFLPGAAIVGFACLALLIIWPKTPLAKTLFPAPLAAVLLGVGLSEIFRLGGTNLAIEATHLVGVPVIGQDGAGWSDVITTPDFARIADPAIWIAAITIAIVASLETLLNLEATDKLDPYKRHSPPNRELFAQGVGNSISGLVGGLPMTSVIVRSSVNAQSGARSRVSAITHGVLLLGSVALLPTLLNRIPLAALAAILIVTGFKLASPGLFRSLWKQGFSQFVPFVITIVAIVWSDLLTGVLIGLGVSFAFILWRNLTRGIHVVREEHVSGLLHRVELGTQASFLNRARLTEILDGFSKGDQVVIDARMCDDVDPDVMATIRDFIEETAPQRGIVASTVGFKDGYPVGDRLQYVDWTSREVQASLTPGRVLQVLKEGNERFHTGRRLNRDLVRQVDKTAGGQHPMAAILSCIDSRAPAELLFDLGIGDIFSVRLAGNVVSAKALGSMEFACKVAGSKLILVLGHTRCGAVKATCDFVNSGGDVAAETGLVNLASITDPISDAVRAETETTGDRTGGNEAFVNRVAEINVRNMIAAIRADSPTLREMDDAGEIAIVGGMYDVVTGRVTILDGAEETLAAATPAATTV